MLEVTKMEPPRHPLSLHMLSFPYGSPSCRAASSQELGMPMHGEGKEHEAPVSCMHVFPLFLLPKAKSIIKSKAQVLAPKPKPRAQQTPREAPPVMLIHFRN